MSRKGNEPMKRRILLVTLLFACTLIAGCGCQHDWTEATCQAPRTCSLCQETEGEVLPHQWQEATCATPKTCNTCGETEGESLPHTWVEANYQDPKTCSVCSKTEGEPLTPDFVKYGLKTLTPVIGQEYDYVTACYNDPTKKTVGKLTIEEYETCAWTDSPTRPDASLPYKEGYVWKILTFKVKYYDENAKKYGGVTFTFLHEDYYAIEDWENSTIEISNTLKTHTISYHGDKATVSRKVLESSFIRGDGNKELFLNLRVAIQIPEGYDGTVIGFLDAANNNEEKYVYEEADENTLLFRLT